jgi:hypothetical protein
VLKINFNATPKKSSGLEFDVLRNEFDRKFLDQDKQVKYNNSQLD